MSADTETYASLLRRATVDPESLIAADRSRLLPADKALIIAAHDREIARVDAELHSIKTSDPRIGKKRRAELLSAARRGDFQFSTVDPEELRAIENTPGLAAELLEVIP